MPEQKQTRPKSGYSLAEYKAAKRELDKLVAAGVICDGKSYDAWQAEMAEIERKWKARIDKLTKRYPSWKPDSHESRLFHMYARRKVEAQKKCTAKHFPPRPGTPAAAVQATTPASEASDVIVQTAPVCPDKIGLAFHQNMVARAKTFEVGKAISRKDFESISGDDSKKSEWLMAMVTQCFLEHTGKGRGSAYTVKRIF